MSVTRNDKQQNEYLKVILDEIRSLSSQVKKLENEVKELKKSVNSQKISGIPSGVTPFGMESPYFHKGNKL